MRVAASPSVIVEPARLLRGRLRVPGDKSISHRYALLAALAHGTSTIDGYSTGADCGSTLRCLRELGVEIEETGTSDGTSTLRVAGRGLGGLSPPARVLDAGNSGTTMRLLAGILAGHPFDAVLTGGTRPCSAGRCGASSSRWRGWGGASKPTAAAHRCAFAAAL